MTDGVENPLAQLGLDAHQDNEGTATAEASQDDSQERLNPAATLRSS